MTHSQRPAVPVLALAAVGAILATAPDFRVYRALVGVAGCYVVRMEWWASGRIAAQRWAAP